jgi:CDGSH-type Zn-finger protein
VSSRASRGELVVTPYRDGPLLVRGPVRLVDGAGQELEPRREPVALCRCGKSRLRPFCDGTHKLVGFRARGVPELPGGEDVGPLGGGDGAGGLESLRLQFREQ